MFERYFPGRDDVQRLLMEPIAYANGSTLDDPAITFGIVFSNFMSKGVYTFQGGTDVLIKKMAAELKANGVEHRKHVAVEKILTEERDGIAAEPPLAIDRLAATWQLEGTLLAEIDGEVVGEARLDASWMGYCELGMMVARAHRGRGVGTALVDAAVEWARDRGLHKLSLSVFPHNAAAIALYRKLGFVEEGRRVKQVRRQSGELWDLIDMGLLL